MLRCENSIMVAAAAAVAKLAAAAANKIKHEVKEEQPNLQEVIKLLNKYNQGDLNEVRSPADAARQQQLMSYLTYLTTGLAKEIKQSQSAHQRLTEYHDSVAAIPKKETNLEADLEISDDDETEEEKQRKWDKKNPKDPAAIERENLRKIDEENPHDDMGFAIVPKAPEPSKEKRKGTGKNRKKSGDDDSSPEPARSKGV